MTPGRSDLYDEYDMNLKVETSPEPCHMLSGESQFRISAGPETLMGDENEGLDNGSLGEGETIDGFTA